MTWKPNEANAKARSHPHTGPQARVDHSRMAPSSGANDLHAQRARGRGEWCWGPADLAQHVKERAEEKHVVQHVDGRTDRRRQGLAAVERHGGRLMECHEDRTRIEQATSRDVRRDGQSLHETARKRGHAVGSRRYEEREERTTAGERRADPQRVRKGKTAGKNLQGRLAAASRSRRSSFRRGSQARDGGGCNEDQHSLRRVEARVHGAGD